MDKFTSLLEKYRKEILEEEPATPAAGPDPAAAGAVGPDPAAAGAVGPDPDAAGGEEPDAEEIVDELEKQSKKPWVDLAGILSRAVEYTWTDDKVEEINKSLPRGLSLRDFIDVRTSPNIRDKYDANIVSASIKLFDIVENVMERDDMESIVPADER